MVGKLVNRSDSIVYLKSETGPGVIRVLPGTEHPSPGNRAGFDGFWSPQQRDKVYKYRDLIIMPGPDIIFTNDGPNPFGPDSLYEGSGFASFKDKTWVDAQKDTNWSTFMNEAIRQDREGIRPGPAGGGGGGGERHPMERPKVEHPGTGWHEGPGGGHLWTGGDGSSGHSGLLGTDPLMMESPSKIA